MCHKGALTSDAHLKNGLNVFHGQITCGEVARDLEYDYIPSDKALSA